LQAYCMKCRAKREMKDPIFISHLTHTFDHDLMLALVKEGCFYELAESLHPGLVVDVNILPTLGVESMVVFQVKKRDGSDEGLQRNIINACLGISLYTRLVVVVDEDVDIYSADDILWAIASRVDPASDVVISGAARRVTLQPVERFDHFGRYLKDAAFTTGAIGMDATIPFNARHLIERIHYPVDDIDISRWLAPEQLASIRAMQSDYAKLLARTGW